MALGSFMSRNPYQQFGSGSSTLGERALQGLTGASETLKSMTKNTSQITEGPGKTATGALISAGSTAATGYAIGAAGSAAGAAASGAQAGSAGGYWGAAIGAIVGLAAYMLS